MFIQKSDRQVNHTETADDATFRVRKDKENPNVVGLPSTNHHDTRNNGLIELLSSLGYCLTYTRTMLLETSLANAVIKYIE